jgi:hypothetical protein
MVINYRVNLGFAKYSDGDLNTRTGMVVTCMTGNAFFPNSPVTPVDLEAKRVAFWNAVVAAQQGGTQLTADKNNKYGDLVMALRQIAAYVQGLASQNLAMLLSSGFLANSTNRTQSPLPVPLIMGVDNSSTTKLTVQVQPVANAVAYQARAGVNNVWQPPVISTQSRNLVIPGLVPGTLYDVQACAVGGSTGQSDWTNPISCRAT